MFVVVVGDNVRHCCGCVRREEVLRKGGDRVGLAGVVEEKPRSPEVLSRSGLDLAGLLLLLYEWNDREINKENRLKQTK